MEDAGPGLDPAPRRVERIGVVHGPLLEVPTCETNRFTFENVDRRVEDHAATPCACLAQTDAKLRSSARPCVEDFSG